MIQTSKVVIEPIIMSLQTFNTDWLNTRWSKLIRLSHSVSMCASGSISFTWLNVCLKLVVLSNLMSRFIRKKQYPLDNLNFITLSFSNASRQAIKTNIRDNTLSQNDSTLNEYSVQISTIQFPLRLNIIANTHVIGIRIIEYICA